MGWVRFAPSPTGLLHVGNARAALLNALYARRYGAQFLLRIDDTDRARSDAAFVEALKADLTWMGLSWERLVFQSERLERYAQAAECLRATGRLYPCYETPEELALQRKTLQTQGKPPIYNRRALALSEDERRALESQGRPAHWRFRLHENPVCWNDGIYGKKVFEGAYASDPVLIRADGVPVYTLASVVDDWELGITQVIRGADHLANTAVQLQILEALDPKAPSALSWAHYPLFRMRSGEELSKRTGSMSLQSLREEGIHPLALCSFLAKLGTSEALAPHASLEDLAAGFALSNMSLAEAQFDPDDLRRLNRHLWPILPVASVASDIPPSDFPFSADFWKAIRGNIETLQDVGYWQRVCYGLLPPGADEEPAFREACLLCTQRAPEAIGEVSAWQAFVQDLSQKTGRKGRALFHPLRLLLTGRDTGPELWVLVALMGRERMLQRLAR
ncbi:MAG: glutamate--tRNA ligase [Holosporales bacterium]|jgi:glutamyl-tRNA synthetase|nr:glutamate--tRNA ligase [Holosporales bacterium]